MASRNVGISHPFSSYSKEATVQRYHYDSHTHLEQQLNDFVYDCNFGRRLKTLHGLARYEFICKTRTADPEQLILKPLQPTPGLCA